MHFDAAFWRVAARGHGALRQSTKATADYLRFIHMRSLFVAHVLAQSALALAVVDDDVFWRQNALARVPLAARDAPCDVWVGNDLVAPFVRLPENEDDASDADVGLAFGAPVRLLAGMVFVRNNVRTRLLYEQWVRLERHLWDYQAEDRNVWKEQPALQAALLTLNHRMGVWRDARVEWRAPLTGPCAPDSQSPLADTCLRVCILSEHEFPSGYYLFGKAKKKRPSQGAYLRQHDNSTAQIVAVHANYGPKDGKVDLLKSLDFWCEQ